jgi:Fic/DOC family
MAQIPTQALIDAVGRHEQGVSMAMLLHELGGIARRTLVRRLAALVQQGLIERRGAGRGVLYFSKMYAAIPPSMPMSVHEAAQDFESPDGPVQINLSSVARDILDYVSRPVAGRRPVGYEHRFLDEYQPNRTTYLPDAIKVYLHKIGRPIDADRAAGTFARDILARLLIDLSWSSSRLEGNTYNRLDTQRLIEFGQAAQGKDAKETQMILNHKAAIELLVDGHEDIGINQFTLLNLHALLSEELMADPQASGRLRRRPVEIGKSVYVPLAVPQAIEARFALIIDKAAAIHDPYEQAFFLMVQVPYLQPFEDVNKRVSRLAANIPLIQNNLCPLSFVDVPERAYVLGTLGIYEMTRMELLRDVFVWAYERSCQRYVVVRDSIAEPDLFRMKYRNALTEVIGGIIREGAPASQDEIVRRAQGLVDAPNIEKFAELTEAEFARLYEGNIARYRVKLGEYREWKRRAGNKE